MQRESAVTKGNPSLSLDRLSEAELARSGLRVGFPPVLEARYRLDTAPERIRELRIITRFGGILYFGCGLLLMALLVSRPSWRDTGLQLAGVSLVILLAQRFFRHEVPDRLREAALLACCLAGALAAILVVYLKPGSAGLKDFVLAALPANFVLMFVRIRFRSAVVFVLVTFAAYAAAVLARDDVASGDAAFLIGVMAILCLPALIGAHAFERVSRRIYLHGLLQRLRNDRLSAENTALTDLSLTDPLTRVANRRRLDAALPAFCAASSPGGALLLIDIDGFKAFNDRHGHIAGDACLQQVARCLALHLRPCDLLARYGGEEFAVLLPGLDAEATADVAERLRAAVAVQMVPVAGGIVHVTVSIGFASRSEGACGQQALIAAADAALYAAKRAGRNRVMAAAGQSA